MVPGASFPAFRRIGNTEAAEEYSVSSAPMMFSCRASRALLIDWSIPSISSVWNSMQGSRKRASWRPSPEANRPPTWPARPTAWRISVLSLRGCSFPAAECARPRR